MAENPETFVLDHRLAADTLAVAETPVGPLLLMNDSRWPWLILVPAVEGAEELSDLFHVKQSEAVALAASLGDALKRETGTDKINIAAIGNIVRQLHIHIVARKAGDPNWPKPVWGFEKAVPYGKDEAAPLIAAIREALRAQSKT